MVMLTVGDPLDAAGVDVITSVVVPVDVILSAPLLDANVFESPR